MINERYYFLFAVALVWILFATIQDLRKREVANWLNFSLIAIAFSYRVFYSNFNNDWSFLLYGIYGFALFFLLGYLFYYGKVFAGGDSKLLIALGGILPFETFGDLFYVTLGFLFVLFFIGTIYSLIYSIIISVIRRKRFVHEFKIKIKSSKIILTIVVALVAILVIIEGFIQGSWRFSVISSIGITLLGMLYIYLMAVDKCMIALRAPGKLTEGDWILNDIKVGNKWIRKSVHGLSLEEIRLLRKSGKSIYVKDGIPFIPVFLVAFIMVVVLSILLLDFRELFSEALSLFLRF
jgi:Flp pilus assembly protein protease CpaA